MEIKHLPKRFQISSCVATRLVNSTNYSSSWEYLLLDCKDAAIIVASCPRWLPCPTSHWENIVIHIDSQEHTCTCCTASTSGHRIRRHAASWLNARDLQNNIQNPSMFWLPCGIIALPHSTSTLRTIRLSHILYTCNTTQLKHTKISLSWILKVIFEFP